MAEPTGGGGPGAPGGENGLPNESSFERWWAEHSRLDELVAALEEALGSGGLVAAVAALGELIDTLVDHFDAEEKVYFPVVERLSPQHASLVQGARLGHRLIHERLDQTRELVETGQVVAARRALTSTLELFHAHERDEEKLVSELEAEEKGRSA